MTCTQCVDCTCDCCLGTRVETPQGEQNLPGLPAIAYRTGTWTSFRASMLARLSSADYPALAALTTRDPDDFSIALLDASSVVLDILTFYQERLANESYLRTARQRDSLTQLARLIGYQPQPGVAASVYLAFTVKAASGQPSDPATAAVTIPAGSSVQSVPAPGQVPQVFETSAPILTKADWNALPVQTGTPWRPAAGMQSAYLAGTSTQLQPGDAIVIVGDERLKGDGDGHKWDVRLVSSVQPDNARLRTLVSWTVGLDGNGYGPASVNPVVYALRQRAALFGYNALNPLLLAPDTVTSLLNAGQIAGSPPEWDFGVDNASGQTLGEAYTVDLDAVYAKLVPGGWLILIQPDGDTTNSPAGAARLYLIESVTAMTRSDYAVSAKISRVLVDDTDRLDNYYASTRQTSVLAQSEALPAAEQPFDYPLYGTHIDLAVIRPDLVGITALAVTGKAQKIQVAPGVKGLKFVPDDGSKAIVLHQGDTLTVQKPPDFLQADGSIASWQASSKTQVLSVADGNGRSGAVTAMLLDFTLEASLGSDPVVQEVALVSSIAVVSTPVPHTRILLTTALSNCYERAATRINVNVGAATAGQSVTELLGSGSQATPNQMFTLKQQPLTYVQAATPTGVQSTLQVTANGITWTAVPTLYDAAPNDRVYTTLPGSAGFTRVLAGDGIEGATLPTGQGNIKASYRVGLGVAGNVGAGAISTLMDRPLGISGVTNPSPASGGQDAQSIDDIRTNAPLSVLTLGRAVSITDYQNFAASFAGIARAAAIWIPGGTYRGVFLTVAGANGAALAPGSPTLSNLVTALQRYGAPNIALYAQSFLETTFRLRADVCYDPAYDEPTVRAAILATLNTTYAFAARSFGQGVSGDEVAALIQGIPGVVAVVVKHLKVVATSSAGDLGSAAYSLSAYNNWMSQALPTPLPRPCAGSATSICPFIPVVNPGHLPLPAEILVLDPDPKKTVLGVMR